VIPPSAGYGRSGRKHRDYEKRREVLGKCSARIRRQLRNLCSWTAVEAAAAGRADRARLLAAQPSPPAAADGGLCSGPLIGEQRGQPFLGLPALVLGGIESAAEIVPFAFHLLQLFAQHFHFEV
jgi:hypothetical protein